MRATRLSPPRRKTTPTRHVSWSDPELVEAAILGMLGRSNRAIRGVTGLTKCQVSYWLHKMKIRLGDYRNDDNSEVFETVYGMMRSKVLARVKEKIP